MSRFVEEVSKLSKQRLALLCVELQRELEARRQSRAEPIAIIGLGCRLPGGVNGPEDYWRLLENGIDAVGPVPAERWDVDAYYDPVRTTPGKMYTRSGGFLDRVDEFDPEFFGISPREARHMDPQHRLLLEVSWEALEHAGQPADRLAGSRTGVFIGIGTYDYATWQTVHLSHASINAYSGTGNIFCFAAGRLSYLLGLHGPSIALDAACATSLVTVHLACQSLRAGECTLALAGGVNLMLAPTPTIFLSQAQALSPDGRCKTFDASADGYGRSEGCSIVVLKRLSDAVAAGDPVLAIIRGSAVNHDGRSAGLTVPNGAAQQAVIREALAQAGVAPGEIGYVEAHGTGTVLGDPIEIRAIAGVLGGDGQRKDPLWIGTVKTNIGHCEIAAGAAGLTKVVLALQHQTIPANLHYRETNPLISFDEIPARVPVASVPWPNTNGRRIAGINAFGLSGTNAHLVVEEFAPPIEQTDAEDGAAAAPHVLTLSARDAWSFGALAAAWEEALAPGGTLHDEALRAVCSTAAVRRSHHRHRWAAVVHSTEDAHRKVAALVARTSASPSAGAAVRRERTLAFVFSGQGSQWWAMGRELMAQEPVFLQAIEECTSVFRSLGDTSVTEAFRSDEAGSRVTDTDVAQPALFAVQVALVRLLQSWGICPDAVIGHSVGEVAAAHVAGALSLHDAARLALFRGRVMQRATGQGGMAAVQLSLTDATALAAQFDGQLSVAAINSPSSSVLSGETAALTGALAQVETRGLWQRRLPVNYAFHSHQMRPLCGDLLEALDGLRPSTPTLPIVSTVTGREASNVTFDAQYWGRNLTEPVQFAAGIASLIASGHDVFIEIGPQPVLRKAVVECLEGAGRTGSVLTSLRRGVDERTAMLDTVATLYSMGVAVDWRGLYRGHSRVIQLPRYPWHRRRLWLEPDLVTDRSIATAAPRVAHPRADEDSTPEAQHARVLSYLHELRWAPVERGARAVQTGEAGAWLIFADRRGTASSLARALRAGGATCDLVFAAGAGFEPSEDGDLVDPTSAAAFRDLLRSRQGAHGSCRGIVYLWGLDAEPDAEIDAGESQRVAYGGLLNIVQACGPAGWSARQLWVITRGCQSPIASVTPLAVAQAPLWGMSRTILLELPGLSSIAVDLDPDLNPDDDEGAVAQLAEELDEWDGVDQLALRGGSRYVPRIHRATEPATTPGVSNPVLVGDGTYLITGGTGALGLQLARWMVQEGGRHLVLMSRSAPSSNVNGVLQELRSSGADVRVVQGNVAHREDVARVIAEIDQTLPPLRGVVHTAGIIDVDLIERQPWERFAAVFPAKIQGAWNLHTLTESRPLDFFVLFSSTASVFGSIGQANYSAANAFLDALAHYRQSRQLKALAINWGPWADVGMAARLGNQMRQRLAAQGVGMLSPADAVATFAHLLRTETPQAVVTSVDWPTFVATYPRIERTTLYAEMIAAVPRRDERLEAAPYEELRRQLDEADPRAAARIVQDFVEQQFAEALGFESASALDPQRGFLDMGVDSLMATRVMVNLNEALRISLPMSVMFEHSTIAALAAEVERVRTSRRTQPSAGESSRRVDASGASQSRIVRIKTDDPAPLSSAQQGLWFVSRFETDEPAYNESLVLRLDGKAIDEALLARVLSEIVRRHETLRTVFQEDEDGPVQVVRPPAPIELSVEDCIASNGPGLDWLRPRLRAEVRAPFALDKGPLLRARLLRIGPTDHVLLLVTHHLVIDGWSYGVLARELALLYGAFRIGAPSPLPELPVQYRDFARWQRRRLASGELDGQLAYWREQIADVPVLEWPSSVTRTRRTFNGATRTFVVPKAEEEMLAALGQREGATLFMTLLATYIAWVYRHAQQSDFAVGLPVGGRLARETEPLIGLLMNVLPLRARVSGRMTFRELLVRVRQSALEAFAHQDLPFNYLVQKLGVRRDPRWSPVFQTMFVVEGAVSPDMSMPGLHMEPLRVDFGVSKFDLTLLFEQREKQLEGFVEYNTNLFDDALVASMVGHYQQLLAAVVADPDQRIAELPLLTAGERAQIVTEWNATGRTWSDAAASTSLVAWLEAQAARSPEALAVWAEDTTWTYADLHRQANQIARRLQRLGVGAESRVAVWIARSPQLVAALVGVLKAGGAYVPLDPSYPAARLAFQIADAQVEVVLTTRECVEAVPAGPYAVEVLDAPEAAWRDEATTAPAVQLRPEQLAYVIYTSGSTGQPKGAMNTHRGIANRLSWMQATYGLDASDRVLQKTSSSFDVSVWELFWPLGTGAPLVLARPGGQNDPGYLSDLIQRAAVTVVHFVPAMLDAFVAAGGLAGCARVRLIVSSGEALPGPVAARCLAAWPGRLDNLYGPTEAAVDVTWHPCPPEATKAAVIPIGRPVANTQVYVRDAEGAPVPTGVVGELFLGGVQVGRGYWARPELTAERFVPDPFGDAPGARLYRTGDLARYRGDGVVEYVARADQQVKLHGNRIELGEIEAVLRQQPEIRDAAVLLREDEPGARRLVAYVTAANATDLPAQDVLQQRLGRQLPEYMVPSAIVALDAMPLTPNGKVDRRALPVPSGDRPALTESYTAPRTEVEARLAQIWAEVLGLDRVGVHDNFFWSGGHSLLAVQLFSRVRKAFGLELRLSTLLEGPTVAQIANAIVEQQSAGAPAVSRVGIVPGDVIDPAPLSSAQRRLWFVTRVETDEPMYNEVLALRISGELQVPVWTAAFSEIVRRHQILRTVFRKGEDGPVQIVLPEGDAGVPVEDLVAMPAGARDEYLRQRLMDAGRLAFDLGSGPLWRARLFRLQPTEHILVLVMHHIITDGWSYGVLAREAAVLYEAFSHGLASPLPELAIQYADYARWQRRQLQSERVQAQLQYWQQELDGVAALEWPLAPARRSRQTFHGATQDFLVPPSHAAQLTILGQREGATLFMTLLAAFFALLHRQTQQSDFAVGTPVAGRTEQETEPLIGLFVNLLALRARIDRGVTFRELLARARQTTLDALTHQDLPFEHLVEKLGGRRDSSRAPLVQAVFVLQNAPVSKLPLGTLQLERVTVERGISKFDLTLSMEETSTGLEGHLEYNTDLFDGAFVAAMMRHYQQLLEAIVANPDQPVAELPLLTVSEREQMLAWNPQAQMWPDGATMLDRLERQVEATPDAVAVVCEGRALTYAALHRRANQLAQLLRTEGVGPDVPVAVCVARGLELIVALLGVWKAGGAYVPLDPQAPAARLAFMVRDVGAPVVVTTTALDGRVPEAGLRKVYLDRDAARLDAAPIEAPRAGVTAANLAYSIYTSGSTGQPKGVGITHENIASLFAGTEALYHFSQADTWTLFHSAGFDFSVWEMWGALAYGGRLVVVPHDLARTPEAFAALVRDEGVTVLNQTPSAFQAFQTVQPPAGLALRVVIFGGEALAFETLRDWIAPAEGTATPRLVNMYGITETTVFVTYYTLGPTDLAPGTGSRIGRALPNWQIYLLDAAQQPVPVGVSGEIYVGGAGVARGYLGRPDLTAVRFVPDPFDPTPGARLYRTGDLARWRSDGVCEFLGRADQQVKLRGYRIEPGEIEAALRQQPEIRDAAVLLREDEPGVRRLVAYVVPSSPGAQPASDALRDALRAQLPDYMVPAVVVAVDALPLTPNGKVDRKALPAPSGERPTLTATYTAPRTPLEATLARIWADVLRVDRVGIHDNFFDLGGASLSALEIMARLSEAGTSMDAVDPTQIFELQTIAELAAALTAHESAEEADEAEEVTEDKEDKEKEDKEEDKEEEVQVSLQGTIES